MANLLFMVNILSVAITSVSVGYFVTYTAYRFHKIPRSAKLLAKCSDVNVNGTAFSVKGVAPYFVKKLIP